MGLGLGLTVARMMQCTPSEDRSLEGKQSKDRCEKLIDDKSDKASIKRKKLQKIAQKEPKLMRQGVT